MNKYQKAIEVIDTLLHLMCGEEREDGYKPTMEEMSNSMNLLKDLANKADSKHEEITAREMFEALGYEEQFKNSDIYRNKKDGSRIAFDNYKGGTIDVVELSYIPRELLKAINMRCQELGWM